MLKNRKIMVLIGAMVMMATSHLYAQIETGNEIETETTTTTITETEDNIDSEIEDGDELVGDVKTEIQILPWEEISISQATPIPYDAVRQADVFWYKILWRVIDCREKMNRPFVAPKLPLITVLLDAAKEGSVTLYDGLDDEFSTPVDLEGIPALSSSVDSVWVWDPETEIEALTVIKNDFNPETVNKFRIKEVWFFNEETSTMENRILGIAPIMEKYGELGDYQGDVPLFWAYFPELRDKLVRTPAYNPLPNGIQLTFDHLFAMRLFSSYIVKEDNVDDLRIKDYTEGINALYEAEKIQEELFNFEHDLWEY